MDKEKLAHIKENVKQILDKPYKRKFYEEDELIDEIDTEEEDDDLEFIDDDPENYIDTEGSEEDFDDVEVTETPLDMDGMDDGMDAPPTIEEVSSKVDTLMDRLESLEAMLSGGMDDGSEEEYDDSDEDFEDEELEDDDLEFDDEDIEDMDVDEDEDDEDDFED
jgi:hypothetical protein